MSATEKPTAGPHKHRVRFPVPVALDPRMPFQYNLDGTIDLPCENPKCPDLAAEVERLRAGLRMIRVWADSPTHHSLDQIASEARALLAGGK